MTKGKIHFTCEKNKHKQLLTLLDTFCPKHINRVYLRMAVDFLLRMTQTCIFQILKVDT